ncbi:MAG TPA: hypothetical protein VKC60_02695 [Opitutaceae bacterium]|nr:hypothetical protein [Opitutaceae bacterium]
MKPRNEGLDPRTSSNSIELKLQEVTQLFNSMDPSPFYEKDLDHDAEEFIVSWARELPDRGPLCLVLHVEKPLPQGFSETAVQDAVRHYFDYRASINRLELRRMLKLGRTSLMIGSCFLVGCLLLSQLIAQHGSSSAFWSIARESLTIGGWVAMWRPMEIYLYEWWPISRHHALLRRLSEVTVEVRAPEAIETGPDQLRLFELERRSSLQPTKIPASQHDAHAA